MPYGTQEQGSIAEFPQPTRKLSSPLCLPDSYLFILILWSLWFLQAHGHTKTALLGMAHEFQGYTPESRLKFQNSWEISDGQSLGERGTSIRLTLNKINCLNSDGNEVKSWVAQ